MIKCQHTKILLANCAAGVRRECMRILSKQANAISRFSLAVVHILCQFSAFRFVKV